MMGSFVRLPSPSPHLTVTTTASPSLSSPPTLLSSLSQLKISNWAAGNRITVLFPAKCSPGPSRDTQPSTSSSSSSEDDADTTPSTPPRLQSGSFSTYNWSAVIGALGFLETSYLTYLKLSNSEAFCPIGGGTCGDVLNSDYSLVFGVPLPLMGMISYGFISLLSLQLIRKQQLPFGIEETDARLILFSSSASMAAASAYFLYILSSKFDGASCLYCLTSAALSFSLFFVSLKNLGGERLQKAFALPLLTAASVLAILSTSYSYYQPISSSSAEMEMPYYSTEITTESSPLAVSLAKHLHSVGAKMYGAFWCSHCQEQKQMFGREAAKVLDYVECFPSGYKKGIKIEKACSIAGIEGFPTWVINGEVLSGQQDLEELARVSGFQTDDISRSKQLAN